MMATPHPELEVWGQLAAAMGSSLEEVCNMQGQERDHLIRVILPSGGAGDSQTGSEETLIVKTYPVTSTAVSSGAGIDSIGKTNVQKLNPSVLDPKKDLKEVKSRIEKTVEILKPSTVTVIAPAPVAEVKDAESRKGRFSWISLEEVHLPLVLRGEERRQFCSVRVLERGALQPLLELPSPVLWCAGLEAETMTEHEARLHNEINARHMDGKFGRELFNTREKMVRVVDLEELVTFLGFCRQRLSGQEFGGRQRCGFVRILDGGDSNDVPYVEIAGVKHLPVFYFEGNASELSGSVVTASGWELAYLRFLCSVQGVRRELLEEPTAGRLLSLPKVLEHFPPSATTEEFWPSQTFLPSTAAARESGVWAWLPSRAQPVWLGQLTLIKDFSPCGGEYRLQRARIADRLEVDVIGVRPGQTSELLVTLGDLATGLGPSLGLEGTRSLLARLGVALYSPNRGQARLLEREGKDRQLCPVPLVLVSDVVNHLAELLEMAKGVRRVGS